MSIRFSLYAIHLPRFRELLAVPLADLLRRYAAHGRLEHPGLMINAGGMRWFYARDGRILFHPVGTHDPREIPGTDLASHPELARTLEDHLAASDVSALWNVCRAFSACDGADFIVSLLSGFKTGPPEALIRIADAVFGPEHATRRRLVDLFRKVFRRLVTQPPFDGPPYGPADFDFPVKPREDGIGLLSVWTPDEARAMVDALEQMDRAEAAGKSNLYRRIVSADPEWEAYYREMVRGLLRLRELPFPGPTVVGFIDT